MPPRLPAHRAPVLLIVLQPFFSMFSNYLAHKSTDCNRSIVQLTRPSVASRVCAAEANAERAALQPGASAAMGCTRRSNCSSKQGEGGRLFREREIVVGAGRGLDGERLRARTLLRSE